MRKKFFTALLGICLLFVLLPMAAQASSTEDGGVYNNGKITWKLSDGVLTISGEGECKGAVEEAWDNYRSEITSIIIESGMTAIGYEAFKDCANLKNITIPETVSIIGGSSFKGCSCLESIELPDSVLTIGDWAFGQCTNLKSVKMPNNKVTIRGQAFIDCASLTSITIPDNAILQDGAFSGWTGLKNIEIPNSMTAIPRDLFFYCSNLTSITIPDGVTSIGMQAFSGCESLSEMIIPKTVTSIGERAFSNCKSLTNIVIPDGVTSIEADLFSGCTNLKEIKLPESITSIFGFAFSDCNNLENIVIPKNVSSIGAYTFFNCKNLKNIVIPDGVTKINNYTFCQCYQLSSITIPKSVTSIGERAFYWCAPSDIYYKGSEEQWSQVTIGNENNLSNATFHYMPEEPIIPEKKLDTPVLKASAETESVKLTWNPIDGATGYEISRSDSQSGNYSKIQSVSGGSAFSFTDTSVIANTTYYYKIRAVMTADGETVYSSDSAVVSAKPLGKTYTIKATASSGGKANGGAVKKGNEKITLTAVPNAGYYFTGWKENGKKVSSSQTYTFKVEKDCTLKAEFSKLSVPSLTVASANAASIKLNWKKITGATGYEVYRAASKNGKYKKTATISKTTTYTDKKLTTGKAYYYKVRAVASGTAKTTYSNYSSIKNTKPVPGAPTGFKASAGSKSVKLSWKKVSGTTGYEVYRAAGKNGKYEKVKTISKTSTVTYIDKRLTAKKNYYYKIRSYKTISGKKVYSSFSTIKSAKTKK